MSRATFLAACWIAIAAPCVVRAQPPASGQVEATDDQADAQQPASDAQDDQQPADAEAGAPRNADVDAARVDQSAAVDGVPAWVFDLWCITDGARPPQGWGISRDHSAGYRVNGRTSEGIWSAVSVSERSATLDVNIAGSTTRLTFGRRSDNDAAQDIMLGYGRRFEHCGAVNFNERF